MDNRSQFTFYRSFWEAVQSLPKKDKLPVLEAIISYALDGAAPSSLSQSQNAFFLLVKPNLDASRKKAASGKQGGSKPKANGKQNASKKENEVEKEEEIESEIEEEYECNNRSGSNAGAHDGRIEKIAHDLFSRYVGRNPTGLDCDLTYNRVVFGGQINDEAVSLLEYAFEAAHKAGKSGNWNYITAVLDRCSLQNIFTAEAARQADEERENHE